MCFPVALHLSARRLLSRNSGQRIPPKSYNTTIPKSCANSQLSQTAENPDQWKRPSHGKEDRPSHGRRTDGTNNAQRTGGPRPESTERATSDVSEPLQARGIQ